MKTDRKFKRGKAKKEPGGGYSISLKTQLQLKQGDETSSGTTVLLQVLLKTYLSLEASGHGTVSDYSEVNRTFYSLKIKLTYLRDSHLTHLSLPYVLLILYYFYWPGRL